MSMGRKVSAIAGLVMVAGCLQGAAVTVNLGQTNENFTLDGLGGDGSGNGFYTVIQGPCSFASGDTTCMITGAFTGTTAGYTAGTYSLVTTYAGNGPSPLMAETTSPGSNFFTFTSIPATTTITLDLTETSASYMIPLFANDMFVNGYNVVYGSSATCSGAPVGNCSVNGVGLVAGSVITGPVTGASTFDTGSVVSTPVTTPTATPEPRWLGLTGLLFGAFWLTRKKFFTAAA